MPEQSCLIFDNGDLILGGKYRVERCLGRGGFAEVYLVTHLALNAPHAVKVLHRRAPGVGSTQMHVYRERFTLEAQLGAQVEHPHIVRVYDFVEEESEALYLIMEYAPGGNLYERIEAVRRGKRPPLSVEEVVRLGLDVARGLAALHERQIVHRDLKPSNILFDAEGRAKVADLGLAQVPGGPSMRSQVSAPVPQPGTPAYMSPEQIDTYGYLSPASDVFSLGAVLFEALTGKVYRMVRPGTRVRDEREDVPEWLDDLIARMLAEDPTGRPWDGGEVATLLEQGVREETEQRRRAEKVRLQEVAQQALAARDWARLEEVVESLRALDEQGARAYIEALEEHRREEERRRAEEGGRRRVERLRHEAEAALEAGEWARLEAVVQTLAAVDKEAARPYEEALKRHQQEEERARRVAELKSQGERALLEERWDEVKRVIRDLKRLDPAAASELRRDMKARRREQPTPSVSGGRIGGRVFLVGLLGSILILVLLGRWWQGEQARRALSTAENVERVTQLARLGKGSISEIAYSPDGRLLAVGSSLGVYLYDAATLEEVRYLETPAPVYSVAFSPDGTLLASGSDDTTVRLWRVSDGRLLRTLEGHTRYVWSVAFSPDGTLLASGSMDHTVRLWGIPQE